MPLFRTLFGLLNGPKGVRADTSSPVDVDSLQISDVRRMFKLRRTVFDNAWSLREDHLLDFSLDTCKELNEIARKFDAPATPASWYSRLQLDVILNAAVQAEAEQPCAENKGPILATLRSPLTDPVRFRGRSRILQTKADYCVISDWDRRYLSTKLVVVAAGVEGRVAGVCRCLSSMAMIHRMRREEKRDPVVYGCYSDGVEFTFYRIDHKSRMSSSTLRRNEQDAWIYTRLRLISRSAAHESQA